jgi:hypothetical protein
MAQQHVGKPTPKPKSIFALEAGEELDQILWRLRAP